MKMILLAATLALISGLAQAAQPVVVPVETFDLPADVARSARWEEARDIPHDKAADLIAAGEKAGGACHELTAERMVVCFFQGDRSVGIDWKKLSNAVENGEVSVPSR